MFVVSYKFEIHSGLNTEFEKAWKEVTHLIYRHSGSLGSRLYKTAENAYFGIAQWPDKKTWDESDFATFDTHQWRAKMRECCAKIEKLDELELIHDLWVNKPFAS
jgi:heme-degrading monooxygenase HmoA